MTNKKVYISQDRNSLTKGQVSVIKQVESHLEGIGYTVVNPLKEVKVINLKDLDYSKVDYALVIEGWREESFSLIDVKIAKGKGIPVVYFHEGGSMIGSGKEIMINSLANHFRNAETYIVD